MADPLSVGLRALTRRPELALVLGGAVVIGGIELLRGSQGDSSLMADLPADGTAAAADATDAGATYDSSVYSSPLDSLLGYSGPGDYGYGTDGADAPQYSAEGCALPVPTVPTSMAATHRYVCRSEVWVLEPLPAQRSPEGCPLPRPVPDPLLKAQGYVLYCEGSTKRWRYREPAKPQPAPAPQGKHHLTVSPGQHRLVRVIEGRNGAHVDPTGGRTVRVAARTVWNAMAAEAVRPAGGGPGARMAKITGPAGAPVGLFVPLTQAGVSFQ